jgi:hypothetical protein
LILTLCDEDGAAGPWVSYNKETKVAMPVEHYATKVRPLLAWQIIVIDIFVLCHLSHNEHFFAV